MEVEQSGSGRLPFVPVMKPADLRDRYDATSARRGDRALELTQLLLKALERLPAK